MNQKHYDGAKQYVDVNSSGFNRALKVPKVLADLVIAGSKQQ